MVNYTNDDVIAYIYNELPIQELVAFENELSTNWALQEKVNLVKEVKVRYLSTVEHVSPSQSCIDRILNYATAMVANA